MHSGDQNVHPDFGLHPAIGLPQMTPTEPFWPNLPFNPMFNPTIGLPWHHKAPLNMPSFHAFLSQYVLSGGIPPMIANVPSPYQEERSSRSSSPETTESSQLSPAALEALRLRTQEMYGSSASQQKLHAKS